MERAYGLSRFRVQNWQRHRSWLLGLILAIVPIAYITQGPGPADDALRYCANAVHPRPWRDIVVLKPMATQDTNPGWDAILRWIHESTGIGKEGLLFLSVVGLFLIAITAGLYSSGAPGIYITCVGILALGDPDIYWRISQGRPLILSMAGWIILTKWWERNQKVTSQIMAGTILITFACAWIHGAWYLPGLLVPAIMVSSGIKRGLQYTTLWLIGCITGGMATGNAFHYLAYQIEWARTVFGTIPQQLLATELQRNSPWHLLLLPAMAAYTIANKKGINGLRNLAFITTAGCLIGSLISIRLWIDYGTGSLLIWLCHEIQEWPGRKPRNIKVLKNWARTIGAALFIGTGILGTTQAVETDYTLPKNVAKQWEPESGGIIYNNSAATFFKEYYKDPTAKWKWAIGFEPGMVPRRIQKGFIEIRERPGNSAGYNIWAKEMTEKDRMVITEETLPPCVKGIGWRKVGRNLWIGRLKTKQKTGP